MDQLEVAIVKRSELHRFVVLPKRWLVERTIAWLNRCRRLAKDWENRSHNALAFLRLLPPSASCSGNYAIQHEPSGQTLNRTTLAFLCWASVRLWCEGSVKTTNDLGLILRSSIYSTNICSGLAPSQITYIAVWITKWQQLDLSTEW